MNISTRIRRVGAVAASALIAVSAAACSGSNDNAGGHEVSVQFAADSFTLGSQMYVAMDQGYFAEQGIKAVPQTYQTGIDAAKAVIAGQADIAPALDFATLSVLSDKVTILASIATPKPGFHKLAVRSDFTKPQDLKGKKMGFVAGTAEAYITTKYLEQNGLSDSVQMISLPGLFELVGALKTGDIDAAWVWANGTDQVKEDSHLKIAGDDSIVPHQNSIFLLARTDWAKQHADLSEKILRAYDKADTFISQNNKKAAQIIATADKGDASAIESTLPGQNFGLGMTKEQMSGLQEILNFMVSSGNIKDPGQLSDYFDLAPLKKVVPSKVTV
jgi:NitT/TauT family transport system substrate-binding protein